MSAEYSHYERDQYRRPSRRQEYRTTFTYAQRVYEPKSSDKNSKTHDQQQENSPKNYNDYDNYENHDNSNRYTSKNDRYNNYSSRDNKHNNYRQKGHQRERRDGNYRIGYWIKEAVPVVKENKETVKEKKEATPENKSPVSKESGSDAEDKKLIHMSSGGSAVTNSTDASETRKADDIFDSPEKKSDSMQTVEDKDTSGSDDEKDETKSKSLVEKVKKNEDKNQQALSEKTKVKEIAFEDNNVKQNNENKEGEEKESVETDESDRENYSNIDELVEKRLMSNTLEEQDQIFDDFGNEIKKEDLNAIMNDERPVWENVDTKKVLEDIQNEEYLFMLPQDIKSWANKEWESIANSQNEKTMSRKEKESENLMKFCFKDDDDDEEYDRIFSVRKFDRGFSRPTVDIAPVPPTSNNGFRNHFDTATVNNNPDMIEDVDSGLLGAKSANLPIFRSQYMQTPLKDAQIQSSKVPQGKGLNEEILRTQNMGNLSQHVDPPKYLFKRFSPDYDAHIWFYIDAYETIQGPFSGRIMDDWLARRCLPLDLRVAMGHSTNFNRLNELTEIYTQELRQSGSPNSLPQNSSFSPQERPRVPSFHNQQAYPTNMQQRRSPLSPQCMTDLYIPFESLPNQCQPLVKTPEESESPVLESLAFQREDSRPRGLNIPKKASNKPILDENYNTSNMESFYQEPARQKCSPLTVRNNNFLYNNSPVNNAFVPIIPKRSSPQNSTAIYASAPNTPFGNMMSAMKPVQPFTPTYTNCVALNQLQDFAWKAVIDDDDDDILEIAEISRTN